MSRLRQLTWRSWEPALLNRVRSYTRADLSAGLVAGLAVGVVALPLAMAFVVAWNMGAWREIGGILKRDLADKSLYSIRIPALPSVTSPMAAACA